MAASTMEPAFKENTEANMTAAEDSPSAAETHRAVVNRTTIDSVSEFYFDSQLKLWRSSSIMTWAMTLFGVFCFVMGFLGLFRDDFLYAGVLFVCSGVAFMGLIVAVVAGYKTYAKWYFVTPILTLFFFLVLHGGVAQTGLYWCVAFTPGTLYMVGPRVGAVLFAIVLVSVGVIFYADLYPWPDRIYSAAHEIRFMLAFSGAALFGLGHDYILIKSGLGEPDWKSHI